MAVGSMNINGWAFLSPDVSTNIRITLTYARSGTLAVQTDIGNPTLANTKFGSYSITNGNLGITWDGDETVTNYAFTDYSVTFN